MYSTLVKIFLKQGFSFDRMFHMNPKNKKRNRILMIVLLVYLAIALGGSFGYLFFELGNLFNQSGILYLLLIYVFAYEIAITFIFGLLRSNGTIFQYKDYQILSPLPINPRTVLLSKLTVMMIYLYGTALIFTSPIIFSYFYYATFGLFNVLWFIIGFILIPLIPLMLLSFISLFISRITAGFRKSKIFTIIFLFAVTIGIMILQISFSSSQTNPLISQQAFMDSLGNTYYPLKWFMQGLLNHDILSIVLFIGVQAIPFVIYFLAIQGLVNQTNQKGLNVVVSHKVKEAKIESSTLMQSLVAKEFRKFISVPIYIMNTGFGIVLLLFMAIVSIFAKDQVTSYLDQFISLGVPFEYILLALVGFMLSMLVTPAISLSLEGKNFWIIKSLPIQASTVMLSKVIFNLILGYVAVLVSMTILSITFGFSLISSILMILYLLSLITLISFSDSFMNLFFPKFDYTNEVQVVKQSMATVVSIFLNFSFLVLAGLITYLLIDHMTTEWILLINLVLNFSISYLLYLLLNKYATRFMNKFPG